MNFIREAGFFSYPILLCGALSLGLAIRGFIRLGRGIAVPDPHDAVLFWGAFAAVLGVIGTLGGIAQAAGALQNAGAVSAPVIWGGFRIALHPVLMGLLILCVSALLWFTLRSRRVAA